MMRPLLALLCLGLVLAAGSAGFTSAAFTASSAMPSNSVAVDQLSNHFSVASAGAVQVGTSTPVASGNVDSLSLDFGTVPSARTFTNVFRVTNVGSSSATAVLTPSLPAQITSVQLASSGSTTATLAAGASTTVSVTTSSTVAGHGTGTLRLGLSGASWMYRTYSVTLDEAPEAPGAPTATAGVGGKISVIGMDARPAELRFIDHQLKAASVYGSLGHCGSWDFPNVIALMASGRINMEYAITRRHPLESLVEAIEETKNRSDGKVLVKPVV